MPRPNLAVRKTLRPRTRLASRSMTAQNSRTQQRSTPHLGSGVAGTPGAVSPAAAGTSAALWAASDGAFNVWWVVDFFSSVIEAILSSEVQWVSGLIHRYAANLRSQL